MMVKEGQQNTGGEWALSSYHIIFSKLPFNLINHTNAGGDQLRSTTYRMLS